MQNKLVILALAVAGVVGSVGSASALVRANDVLAGCGTATGCEVDVDTRWGDGPGEDEIILDGPVIVKDGATLTIDPGVIIRGQPRYAAVAMGMTRGTPGMILVTTGGEIRAVGTPAVPIVMTTAAVDNDSDFVADDFDANGFEDQFPGFTGPCVNGGLPDSPEGPDNVLGTGDDTLGTCVIDATPTFLDLTPEVAPLAPLNPDGFANVALWGGVVLNGRAPMNNAGTTTTAGDVGTYIVEGLTVPGYAEADAICGGQEPHDSSGVLQYVSIRHAGDEIGNSNELNGLTMCAVGDGTVIEFVEVYANFDDGFEWFGGTVNTSNLVVAYVGDDSLDTDQGYTGVNQFSLSLSTFFNELDGTPYGSVSGDNAMELDGENCLGDCNLAGPESFSPTGNPLEFGPLPFSSALFYNFTHMGNALNVMHRAGALVTPQFALNDQCTAVDAPYDCCTGPDTGTCDAAPNQGLSMQAGFAGEIRNSYVVNTGAEEGLVLGTSGAPGWSARDNGCADTEGGDGFGDLLRIMTSTFDDVAPLVGGGDCTAGGVGAQDDDILANGDAITPGVPGPLTSNIYNNVATRTGGVANAAGLRNEDTTFDPQGNATSKLVAAKAITVDPRAQGALGFSGAVSTEGHPVADPAALYRGAFSTSAVFWTTGWTAMSLGGVLP